MGNLANFHIKQADKFIVSEMLLIAMHVCSIYDQLATSHIHVCVHTYLLDLGLDQVHVADRGHL